VGIKVIQNKRVLILRCYHFHYFSFSTVIMRFVIPVVFYEITNVECVYSSNTTIFIGRI